MPSGSHPARSLCRLDLPPAAVAMAVAPPTVMMMAMVVPVTILAMVIIPVVVNSERKSFSVPALPIDPLSRCQETAHHCVGAASVDLTWCYTQV